MKPILKFPDHDLTWPAIWSFITGILCLYIVSVGVVHPAFLILGIPTIAFGIGMWQEQRWAVWGGLIWFSLSTTLRVLGLFVAFQWRHVLLALAFASFAWNCWEALKKLGEDEERALNRDRFWDEEDDDEEDEDSDEEPLISFVLLQREQKYLEGILLAKTVESAWGGHYSAEQTPPEDADGFIVGESPLFIVHAEHGTYLVNNHVGYYWDNVEELLPEINDLRLRKAVADHTSWMSVDLVAQEDMNVDGTPDPAEYYPNIAKLIVELADDDTLVVLQPESMEVNVWSEEVAEMMTAPDAHLRFSEQTNVPVIEISDDDPDLIASVEKARETWPDFVAAFKEKAEGCSNYGVKVKMTVDGETEFIWLEVIGLEPKFIHGTLANDPVMLGDLKLGSQVEVPLSDMQDWCYLEDGEPVGLYSLAAVQKAQERQS